jgi:hypothetical protein
MNRNRHSQKIALGAFALLAAGCAGLAWVAWEIGPTGPLTS